VPVIGAVTCEDIRVEHTQAIVNAAPTAGEGDRVRGMVSALVSAGIDAGYLVNFRLAKVHWQAGDRPLPAPTVSVAGESGLWADPAEIPSDVDVIKLGQALGTGRHGERDELMANTAAYSGLRWGELTALTVAQVEAAARVITVDRKVVEVAGHLYLEAPKNRKYRRTIYPRRTPGGYPLADRLAARIEVARAEQEAGTNPLGLLFPSPAGRPLNDPFRSARRVAYSASAAYRLTLVADPVRKMLRGGGPSNLEVLLELWGLDQFAASEDEISHGKDETMLLP
jgi:integrase